MFSGNYSVKLDEKGRFILPARLRDAFTDGLYITISQEHCLAVYTSAGFQELAERVRRAPSTVLQVRKYQRMMLGRAFENVPDKQGRTVIPSSLRTWAGLDKDLVIVGAGDRLEIWDEAEWDAFLAEEEAEFADLDRDILGAISPDNASPAG